MRLELDGVTAGYGSTTVLRDVSLVVPEGQVAALLGPNGAGKTTLLSVASGLVAPRAGRVLVDGRDVTRQPTHRLAAEGLCHVPEGRSIFPSLSVADNLRMFGRSIAGSRVDRALEAFPRLSERSGQLAGTMSGGEQQMLALARAYVQRAPIVMLDEVSMGLAPLLVEEIFRCLEDLASDGHGLLIVEQYASKVLSFADLAYVLVKGRIVFAGEPNELTSSDLLDHYIGSSISEPVA